MNVADDTGRYLADLFGVTATPAYIEFGAVNVLIGRHEADEFD
ncbi:hypothetical protein ACQEUU_02865 [Nonomuraea sp. CA-218870]